MAGLAFAERLWVQVPPVEAGFQGGKSVQAGAPSFARCLKFNPLHAESKEWLGAAVRCAGVAAAGRQVGNVMRTSSDAAELHTAGFGKGSFHLVNAKQQARCMVAGASASGLGEQQVDLVFDDGGNGIRGHGGNEGGGSGGGGGRDSGNGRSRDDGEVGGDWFLAALLRGWKDRVKVDPQFPFKVLTEEVIGVGACVLGDMASRPNFGLDELDFVFSTIVVGAILNFTLMYMLAPTSFAGAAASSRLPGVFASCPSGHMFEPGAYSVVDRAGTFVYKGVQFAIAGFLAGLAGTALSNFLLDMRRKMDPTFTPQNDSPPTILNAATWAGHMGLSSNLRYQAVNGIEFALAGVLNPGLFKTSVFFIRGLNNVLGGTSFVTLARLTGSQKAGADQGSSPPEVAEDVVSKDLETAASS